MSAAPSSSLDVVVDLLRCPVCRSGLEVDETSVLCDAGHSFDLARQGYVSLISGRAAALRADTADMLAARSRVLDGGLLDPLRSVIADVACGREILEIGAGTGHYLRDCVTSAPDGARGIGLDLSKLAARRLARVHPQIGAVVADAWQPLPVGDAAFSTVLSVFAPRNVSEFRRVLEESGVLIVASPTADHLAEIIEPMGMLGVQGDKARRIGDALGADFERADRIRVEYSLPVARDTVADLVRMGPSAFHLSENEIANRATDLDDTTDVTFSVTVSLCRPLKG